MLTVTAVYKGGVLLPATKLDLPDNTRVKVQILTLPAPQAISTAFGSLAGIGPTSPTTTWRTRNRPSQRAARNHPAKSNR